MNTNKKGSSQQSPFSYTHHDRHIDTMCILCKNEDTHAEKDIVDGLIQICQCCDNRWRISKEVL